ncbi:MAG: hypothetical protein EOP48_03150 [Sphingobacteriales bacterium]|nr:MAG: hypothetical protein EOP48_03150 [Sphingobacteriales bacterium]
MKTVQLLNYTLLVDREATKHVYNGVKAGGSETCACEFCHNYIQSRETAFSSELINLFDRVGIDYKKDYEVVYLGPEEDGLFLYSTWFDFVGSIISPIGEKTVNNHEVWSSNLSVKISEVALPVESHFHHSGYAVVELNILLKLPWTITDSSQ